jgi:hypothetical protein
VIKTKILKTEEKRYYIDRNQEWDHISPAMQSK